MMHPNYGMRRSRTYDRSGARIEEDWTVAHPSGYLSDHGYSNHMPVRYSQRERRPRSATAMRPCTVFNTFKMPYNTVFKRYRKVLYLWYRNISYLRDIVRHRI
ncbi:unnamed protein product [Brugia pahangi]|uniref:Uncharacterized protein n=1 Tax=Brugia pahangi TaxID=6280 RepID=A0A0N4TGT9_BRUPA|nr:unnamed protein product [Brugia pahangi]